MPYDQEKRNYYVVWQGRQTGVFDDWDRCKKQVEGFDKALYKSFDSKVEAMKAYTDDPRRYVGQKDTDMQDNIRNTLPSSAETLNGPSFG